TVVDSVSFVAAAVVVGEQPAAFVAFECWDTGQHLGWEYGLDQIQIAGSVECFEIKVVGVTGADWAKE
ncbi:hypothetical protein A2U01_0033582, partial [Trifolium medium]|nr:hypothetical protein [Trifolium medium]